MECVNAERWNAKLLALGLHKWNDVKSQAWENIFQGLIRSLTLLLEVSSFFIGIWRLHTTK